MPSVDDVKNRLVSIPTNLILGQGPAKLQLLNRLLSGKPSTERWAVLDNDANRPRGLHFGTNVRVSTLADGCLCCVAAVGLRVALTRLLRDARPDRLLVLPSSQANIPAILRLLADRWLGPVLSLRAILTVLDVEGAHGLAGNQQARGLLEYAQTIALEAEGASETEVETARMNISAAAPRARIASIGGGAFDARVLNEPGVSPRPLFHSE